MTKVIKRTKPANPMGVMVCWHFRCCTQQVDGEATERRAKDSKGSRTISRENQLSFEQS